MRLKLLNVVIILVFANSIFAQKVEFDIKTGVEQNLNSEMSPSLFIGVSHKINLNFLQFELGISLLRNKIKSSSYSIFEIPSQIGGYSLVTKLISEEILILEYSSFQFGIVLNSKKKFSFGIGIQPMFQIQQSRKNNQILVNVLNNIVNTETYYEKINFTPYNLEIYSYLNLPISKKFNFRIKYSHGISKIKEKQYIGGYVGTKLNAITTKRISIGLSYSIKS
jgi:hypothetical protein